MNDALLLACILGLVVVWFMPRLIEAYSFLWIYNKNKQLRKLEDKLNKLREEAEMYESEMKRLDDRNKLP